MCSPTFSDVGLRLKRGTRRDRRLCHLAARLERYLAGKAASGDPSRTTDQRKSGSPRRFDGFAIPYLWM